MLTLVALPKAHESVSVVVYLKSHQSKQNPPFFIGGLKIHTDVMKLCFFTHERYICCPMMS